MTASPVKLSLLLLLFGLSPVDGGVRHAKQFQKYENCTLVPCRSNDGDSFLVQLHDGKQITFRLYFVDTPEAKRSIFSLLKGKGTEAFLLRSISLFS